MKVGVHFEVEDAFHRVDIGDRFMKGIFMCVTNFWHMKRGFAAIRGRIWVICASKWVDFIWEDFLRRGRGAVTSMLHATDARWKH